MPIAIGFTITSGLALIGLSYILRELWLNYRAVKKGERNGMGTRVSLMLVQLVGAMWASDLVLLVIGIAALIPLPSVGVGLVLIPIIKLTAAILVIRNLRKQIWIFRNRP